MHSHGERGIKLRQAADGDFFETVRIRKIRRQAVRRFRVGHNQPDIAVEHFQRIVVARNHDDLSREPRRIRARPMFALQITAILFVKRLRVLPPCRQNDHIRRVSERQRHIVFIDCLPVFFVFAVKQFRLLFQTTLADFQLIGE